MTTTATDCGIGRDLADVCEERIADVPERRFLDLERHRHLALLPGGAKVRGLVRVEGEEERAGVLDAERGGVVGRAHRRCVRARDEDAADGAPRDPGGLVVREDRHVGDHHAGLSQEAELERELRAPERRRQGLLAEQLRDDEGHEGRLASRKRP